MRTFLAGLAVSVSAAGLLLATCAGANASVSRVAVPASPAGTATVKISVSDFDRTFRAMAKLKPVTKAGRGDVGVLLPDTVSSTRFVKFDAPYLKKAFSVAGLAASKLLVQNAQGSEAIQLADAQVDIASGAKVLLLDPLDSVVGKVIESFAKAHHVAVIDYDRLTFGGSRAYYVNFSDVAAGQEIGHGLASCATAWGVKKPQLIVMKGDPSDPHSALLAQGYDEVLAPPVKSGAWKLVSEPAGTWNPATALIEFEQQYTAHPQINMALIPDDENAAPIISYLQKQKGVKPRTFPVTGQDATLPALRNILAGYQCGTAYKPVYLEAQGAAALALFLRAGQKPPASLVNGHFKDATGKVSVPAVQFKPLWVTTKNMKATVVADKFVSVAQLCAGATAAACTAAGIK